MKEYIKKLALLLSLTGIIVCAGNANAMMKPVYSPLPAKTVSHPTQSPNTVSTESVPPVTKSETIQKELDKKEEEHKKLTKKAEDLGSEVKNMTKDLVLLSKNIQHREADLLQAEETLKELQKKKQVYIDSIYSSEQSMGGVVSAARKYARNPAVAMMLQENPVNAARSLTIIKSIIPSIDKKSTYLKNQLSELDAVEKKISMELADQRMQKMKMDTQKDQLATLVEKRKDMYQKTQEQSDEFKKELSDLRQQSKNLEDLMENLKTKIKRRPEAIVMLDDSPVNNTMPVEGYVRTKFGDKDDMGAESKGLTFTTISGARVVTPMPGVVKFAGSFQNYKSLLIIEHPNGYHSLISGMDRIDTIVGASLVAGEPIGITSEHLTSPKIYYELRKNGKPVDPQKVLSSSGKGKS